jgi:hypothetical protein
MTYAKGKCGQYAVWTSVAILFAAASMYVLPAAAQNESATDAQAAAPAGPTMRAVRLTFAQGAVSVEAAPGSGAQPAQTNMPLLAGSALTTAADGQAEIEFEDGSVIRLTPNSALTLDTLDVNQSGVFTTNVSLQNGLAYAELRSSAQYRYAINAGGDVLSPIENTTVRIDYDQPPAAFAVFEGTATVARQDGSMRREIRTGELLRADINGSSGFQLTQGIPDDTWDVWNTDRDQAEAAEAQDATPVRDSAAGAQGYGWSDLDADGTWYDVPGQGEVWQPSVAMDNAGFDPYGNGAWVWYPGTGYIWASGYSWGWTPYRCGAWSYYNSFGWGWAPAGCGGLGWGFWPAGHIVNIHVGPGGYRPPTVPRPHPGPVHPILPTRLDVAGAAPLAGQTGWGASMRRGPVTINGAVATPLQRGTGAATALRSGTGATGVRPTASALTRDFPVNRETHAPIAGQPPLQPAVVHTDNGWRPSPNPRSPQGQGETGQSGAPMYRNPQPGQQPRQPQPTTQSPRTYNPQPQTQRPTYTPPPRPTYTPQPHYAPPPAPHSAPAPAARSPR